MYKYLSKIIWTLGIKYVAIIGLVYVCSLLYLHIVYQSFSHLKYVKKSGK